MRKQMKSVAVCVLLTASGIAWGDDWPQWRGPKRDGVWRESGIIKEFPSRELTPLWRASIAGGYSGPTVADGRVYVTDRQVEPTQVERVHCFDSKTGKNIWTHTYDCAYRDVGYDAGPRASVTIHDGRAYALGAMGHLFAFDAAKGTVQWTKDLNAEYSIAMPIWGIAAAPLVEENLLIVIIGGAEDAGVVALDRVTGEERWKAVKDTAGYSAPIIIEQGGKRVLVCWMGGQVVGLDPKSGSQYWTQPFKQSKMVINVATPVWHQDKLFMTAFFDGAMLLKVPKDQPTAVLIWRRQGKDEQHTDALHSIIGTPYLEGDAIYGVDSYGELRGLDLLTGDRLWESLLPMPKARWGTIHFVKHEDRVWMFNERGELIIARLSRKGYEEISRAKLIEPTTGQLNQRGGVCWSHPAFADRHVFIRNDKELVCADLSAK